MDQKSYKDNITEIEVPDSAKSELQVILNAIYSEFIRCSDNKRNRDDYSVPFILEACGEEGLKLDKTVDRPEMVIMSIANAILRNDIPTRNIPYREFNFQRVI